jgi:phage terminase small subunit
MALNPRRQRFVEEYARDGNGAAAALRAGYSPKSAKVQASQLLTDPNVRAAVKQARARVQSHAEMTAVEVLKELALLACSDVRHYRMDPTDGHLTLAEGAPDHAMRAVSSVKLRVRMTPVKDGEPIVERDCEFRLWSKDKALELLAKHFALLIERHEVNLTEQHLIAVRTLSDLELSAFLQALDAKTPEVALRLIKGGG